MIVHKYDFFSERNRVSFIQYNTWLEFLNGTGLAPVNRKIYTSFPCLNFSRRNLLLDPRRSQTLNLCVETVASKINFWSETVTSMSLLRKFDVFCLYRIRKMRKVWCFNAILYRNSCVMRFQIIFFFSLHSTWSITNKQDSSNKKLQTFLLVDKQKPRLFFNLE